MLFVLFIVQTFNNSAVGIKLRTQQLILQKVLTDEQILIGFRIFSVCGEITALICKREIIGGVTESRNMRFKYSITPTRYAVGFGKNQLRGHRRTVFIRYRHGMPVDLNQSVIIPRERIEKYDRHALTRIGSINFPRNALQGIVCFTSGCHSCLARHHFAVLICRVYCRAAQYIVEM